jgi:cytochrome c oxidase subunit 1
MTNVSDVLVAGLRRLPGRDRLLLRLMFGAAVLALVIGVLFGFATALDRAGFIEMLPETGYRALTMHGVGIFFYWLYLAQAALILALVAVHAEGTERLGWPAAAWIGFAAMLAGFALNAAGTFDGTPLLYDGSPDLAGEERRGLGLFSLGYLSLGGGLFLVSLSALATAFRTTGPWSAITFAAVCWTGLVIVSSIAVLNTFLPPALWAAGLAGPPADHSTAWHVLFHNMHYLPLLGTVLVWYVLVRTMTGVESIFGGRFSKIVFSFYLVFVPPTSLYHMFLEPGLAEPVRVAGSLLSLFISVPTVAAFLVIIGSLEANARASGATGAVGWLKALPWRNPAMTAVGVAVINLALGGAFSFVLIQEKLSALLSDTFFVPGYFHFLTVGTVTLTLLAAFVYAVPAVTGGGLWRPGVLRALPFALTAGVLLFAGGGVWAGLMGVPRRTLDVGYDGLAPAGWAAAMGLVGVGAVVMAAALLVYAYGLLKSLAAPVGVTGTDAGLPRVALGRPEAAARMAWTGPALVVVLVLGTGLATAFAFNLMFGLPVLAAGAAGH